MIKKLILTIIEKIENLKSKKNNQKYILKNDLPKELYDDKKLFLPIVLKKVYINKLEELDKVEESKKNQPAIGGDNEDETIEHFVYRFANGAVRSQYIAMDPDNDLENISIQLATVFSDRKLRLLYLPCGSGAGLMGLLTTFYTLRQNEYYPKLPLNIEIIGADYSTVALDIFEDMINSISSDFNSIGIKITYQTVKWDATSSLETMQLMHKLYSRDTDEYFIFFSNFSGAAGTNNAFNDSFQTIFNFITTNNKKSTLLWIEPGGYGRAVKLFKKLKKMLEPIFKLLNLPVNTNNGYDDIPIKNFTFIHPTSENELNGNISGLKLMIDGEKNG